MTGAQAVEPGDSRQHPPWQVHGPRPPSDRRALGEALVQAYGIDVGRITHCNVCHR